MIAVLPRTQWGILLFVGSIVVALVVFYARGLVPIETAKDRARDRLIARINEGRR